MSNEHDLAETARFAELADLGAIPDPFADELAALESMPKVPPLDLASLPPSPSRERLQARRLGMLLIALAIVTAMVLVMKLRGDLATISRAGFLVALLGPLAGGALALVVAMRPGRAGIGPSRGALAGATAFAALSFAIAAGLGALLAPGAAGVNEASWRANLVCAVLGLVIGSVPFVLAIAALRGAFAVVTRLRAGLLGLASGGLAAAALHAHCPNDGLVHVLAGHGFAMLVGAAAAATLARVFRA
jgi:hypothetical protein